MSLARTPAADHAKEWAAASVADDAAPSKPASPTPKPLAFLRYRIFNTYRRLFSLAFLGNVAAFVVVAVRGPSPLILLDAVSANLLASGLARTPLVVNFLFGVLCLVPHSAPLRLRHLACKIFHLGGVHSGCGIAAYVWYLGFIVYYTKDFVPSPTSTAVLVIAYAVLILLTSMILVSVPKFRIIRHDWFELTHRFSAWATIALVWALLLIVAAAEGPSMGMFLVTLPAFWMHLASTAAIIHPWLLLRRVEVDPEPLSSHAVRLHFNYDTSVVFGQGLSVSKHPLRDWHSFAVFTDRHDAPETEFSLLVSKAGDWTSSVIADPPRRLWKRGLPVFGFAYVMKLFRRTVLVATGSGIGPCLAFINEEGWPPMRVLWQTRNPERTYGPRVMELVRRLDPDAEIIDTSEGGRRDLLPIAMRLYREFNAEAVGIISNETVTKQLVYDLESQGIPAYGPIFDS
ncbi:uncharacterized protein PG986_003990 [Apiospora aurea]|uniref:Integral membrane protein TmpA n=1 Tax=Apiospora aurea TaxID=335848 RepID=A0ABR1QLC3_9PEZI